MIIFTESASLKINDLLLEQNDKSLMLRIFIQGGGCSGFNYGFTFDTEKNDDDFEYMTGNAKVVVDGMSLQYLQGSTVDYKEQIMGSNFVINNPNAATTCGCGSSFSV